VSHHREAEVEVSATSYVGVGKLECLSEEYFLAISGRLHIWAELANDVEVMFDKILVTIVSMRGTCQKCTSRDLGAVPLAHRYTPGGALSYLILLIHT
jgi:hypothetical protein